MGGGESGLVDAYWKLAFGGVAVEEVLVGLVGVIDDIVEELRAGETFDFGGEIVDSEAVSLAGFSDKITDVDFFSRRRFDSIADTRNDEGRSETLIETTWSNNDNIGGLDGGEGSGIWGGFWFEPNFRAESTEGNVFDVAFVARD